MTKNKQEEFVQKIITGISSMTLLVFLLILAFILFPRLIICLLILLSIPVLYRCLPRFKQTSQD